MKKKQKIKIKIINYGDINVNYTIDAKKTISNKYKTNSFPTIINKNNFGMPVNTKIIKYGRQSKPEKY